MRNVGESVPLLQDSATVESEAPDNQVLPIELRIEIFSYLPMVARYQAGRTCTLWRAMAWDKVSLKESSLQTLFPNLSIIDKAFWKKNFNIEAHGLTFDSADQLKKEELIRALKGMYSAGVKVNQVTLLTLPKGLTLENLKALLAEKGRAFPFKDTTNKMFERLQNVRTEESYRVLLSHTNTRNSRWRSPKAQERKLASNDLSLPKVLELTALSALIPEKNLYCNWVGARCADRAGGDHVNISRFLNQVFIGRSDPLSAASGLIGAPAAYRFQNLPQ